MSISSTVMTQVGAYTASMSLGLLQTGVNASSGSALLGVSGSGSSGGYTGADLFGGSTSSSAVSIAADTFSSVLSSQGESQVRLSIQAATSRIKAQAEAKMSAAQQTSSAARGVTA